MKNRKEGSEKGKKPLGLYVHIPFCVKKCAYCGFLSFPAQEEEKEDYVKALCKEIRAYSQIADDYLVQTIYFGGGTPSTLSEKQISEVMNAIEETFCILGIEKPEPEKKKKKKDKKTQDPESIPVESPELRLERVLNGSLAEITIELNPKTVNDDLLKKLYNLSFNRLSIGLQSADEKELALLSRIHTKEDFASAFEAARSAGFLNISVDLMAGLPGQSEDSLKKSIRFVTDVNPEHISVYDLQIEEGTPFYDRFGEQGTERTLLPDEETDRKLNHMTTTVLLSSGYLQYEISNYAKPGFESRHNSSYWTGVEYLGFGLGASSLLTNARFHNTEDRAKYMTNSGDIYEIREDIERLTEKNRIEEFMFLGLRMCLGVDKAEFRRRFQKDIETVYGDVLKKLFAFSVLSEKDGRIFLTEHGRDVSNTVFVEFLKDE